MFFLPESFSRLLDLSLRSVITIWKPWIQNLGFWIRDSRSETWDSGFWTLTHVDFCNFNKLYKCITRLSEQKFFVHSLHSNLLASLTQLLAMLVIVVFFTKKTGIAHYIYRLSQNQSSCFEWRLFLASSGEKWFTTSE